MYILEKDGYPLAAQEGSGPNSNNLSNKAHFMVRQDEEKGV